MLVVVLVVLGAFVPACATEDAAPSVTGSTSPDGVGPTSPAPPSAGPTPTEPDLGDARIRLVPVAELEQPVAMAVRAGDHALYVAEKVGRVVALSPGSDPRVVLDLTNRVSLGSEQGLLGLAFSPDGRYLYVDFTDTAGDTHVAEFAFDDDGRRPGERAPGARSSSSRSRTTTAARSRSDRTGTCTWRSATAGAAATRWGTRSRSSTLLGKLLRIDVHGREGRAVRDPAGQPVRRTGRARARRSGRTACATRGASRSTARPATCGSATSGRTRGRRSTSSRRARPAGRTSAGTGSKGRTAFEGDRRPRLGRRPSFEYAHGDGSCAVTGGYVYRGALIPALRGRLRVRRLLPRPPGGVRPARTAGRRRFGYSARGSMPSLPSDRMRTASCMCFPWRGRCP